MDKKQAQTLIKETFESPFDKDKFAGFVKNLLNKIEDASFIYRGNFIPDAYEQYINTLERIGKYTDGEHKIDILIVKLKKETSIERARTMQRNFIAWYLNGSRGNEFKDAALAAFVSPNEEDWRFSLVKMDYRFEEGKKGRMRVKEEFTPARRWSFLVGANESSHTAQRQLIDILADDEKEPTLVQLEEAFNIEKVTKEFFGKYRELFLWIKETLDVVVSKDSKVKTDFESNGVNAVDFAKKLLGQIVFLYFLQKKGWFGVKRDADWGTGPKHFLRELFEEKHGAYKNFFNDILEPLFYEALRIDRSHDDDYYSRFNCKIPFLNGGLFDPINNYDWVYTDVLLPNDLFSNTCITKEGDKGNGILDIFDRYNFTVKEDEPLEKEVAVDPEMLGKVFENLLEVKDRKSKGTYYTPREIVHYMCQQSLINYLHTEITSSLFCHSEAKPKNLIPTKEDIETLIKYGEQVGENEATVETKGVETKTYFYKIPESIRQNAKLIDEKLANIKVCDPAIGSGAFPVGMMSEIVKTRIALNAYLCHSRESGNPESRTPYSFKRECIEKSLYGVDIDSGAVEIAKLRLWLSLVVDEDDIKQIKPLPNLDYKIVCGNSLLGVEKDLFNNDLFSELERLKPLLFNETSPNKKQEYKKQIDELICQITNGHKEFDFEVYFSEVFHEEKGFDVVIANPPYVRQEEIKEYKPFLQKAGYKVYNSTSDLYTYFYEISCNILATNRFSCFISSNKWMRAKYGEKLRNFFRTNTKVINLIDFGGYKVFEAIVDTNILLFQKGEPQKDCRLPYVNIDSDFTGENIDDYVRAKQQTIKQVDLPDLGWILANYKVLLLKNKIEKIGTPLKDWNIKISFGIKTGFNEAFIIDTPTKNRLCAEDPKSVEILKPMLRGRDISKYHYKWAGLWIINAHNGYGNIPRINVPKDYPAIWKYLQKINKETGGAAENRCDKGAHWTNLRDCAYIKDFEKKKIVYPNMTKYIPFIYDENKMYTNQKCYIIVSNSDKVSLKILVGLFNSSTYSFLMREFFPELQGGTRELNKNIFERLPVPQIPDLSQRTILILVDKILVITKDEDYLQNSAEQAKVKEYERQIDQMVYELYGLTKEEIKVVEGSESRK